MNDLLVILMIMLMSKYGQLFNNPLVDIMMTNSSFLITNHACLFVMINHPSLANDVTYPSFIPHLLLINNPYIIVINIT